MGKGGDGVGARATSVRRCGHCKKTFVAPEPVRHLKPLLHLKMGAL